MAFPAVQQIRGAPQHLFIVLVVLPEDLGGRRGGSGRRRARAGASPRAATARPHPDSVRWLQPLQLVAIESRAVGQVPSAPRLVVVLREGLGAHAGEDGPPEHLGAVVAAVALQETVQVIQGQGVLLEGRERQRALMQRLEKVVAEAEGLGEAVDRILVVALVEKSFPAAKGLVGPRGVDCGPNRRLQTCD